MPNVKGQPKTLAEQEDEIREAGRKMAYGMEVRSNAGKAAEEGIFPKVVEGVRGYLNSGLAGPASLLKMFLPDDGKKTARKLAEVGVDLTRDSPGDSESTDNLKRAAKAVIGTGAEAAALFGSGGGSALPTTAMRFPRLAKAIQSVGNATSNPIVKGGLTAAAGIRNFNADPNDYSDIAGSLAGASTAQILARNPVLKEILAVNPNDSRLKAVGRSTAPIIENVLGNSVAQMNDGREGWDPLQSFISGAFGLPGAGMSMMARSSRVNAEMTPFASQRKVMAALGPEGPRQKGFITPEIPEEVPTEFDNNIASKELGLRSEVDVAHDPKLLFDRLKNNTGYDIASKSFSPENTKKLYSKGLDLVFRKTFDDGLKQAGVELSPEDYKTAFAEFRRKDELKIAEREGPKLFDEILNRYNKKVGKVNDAFQGRADQYRDPTVGMTQLDNAGQPTGIGKSLSDKLTTQKVTDSYVKLGKDGKLYFKSKEEYAALKPEHRGVWRNVQSVENPPTLTQANINDARTTAENNQRDIEPMVRKFNVVAQNNPYYQKAIENAMDTFPATDRTGRQAVGKLGMKIADSGQLSQTVFKPEEFDGMYYYFGQDPKLRPLIRQQISKGFAESFTDWANILQKESKGEKLIGTPLEKFKGSIGASPQRIAAWNDIYENPKAFENMTNLLEANDKALRMIPKKKFDPKARNIVYPVMFGVYGATKAGFIPSGMAEPLGFAVAGVSSAALHRRASGIAIMERALQDSTGKLPKMLNQFWSDPVKESRLGSNIGRIFAQLLERPGENAQGEIED